MLKDQKGISLLNLIFVILVMLTLAAVAITMVLDQYNNDPKPVQVEYVEESTPKIENTPEVEKTAAPESTPEQTKEEQNAVEQTASPEAKINEEQTNKTQE